MSYSEDFWDNISLPPSDHTLMDAWELYINRCLKTGKAVKFSKEIAKLEQARINAKKDVDIYLLKNDLQTIDAFERLELDESYAECLTALTEDPELCQEIFLALSSKIEFENSCLSLQQCLLKDKALIERNSLSDSFNIEQFQSRIDFIDEWLPIVDNAVENKINAILSRIGYNLKDLPIYCEKNHWGHIQMCLITTHIDYLTGVKEFEDMNHVMTEEEIEIMFGLKEPPREIKRRRTQSRIQSLRSFIACSKGLSMSDFERMFDTLNMEFFDYTPIMSYVPLHIKPLWDGMSIEEIKKMLDRNKTRENEIALLVARTRALIAEQGSCPNWDVVIQAYENPTMVYPSGMTNKQLLETVAAQDKQTRMWEFDAVYDEREEPPITNNTIDSVLSRVLGICHRYSATIPYERALNKIKEIILSRLEEGVLEELLARGKDKRKRNAENDGKHSEVEYRYKKNGLIIY